MSSVRNWFSHLKLHSKLLVGIYTVLFPVLAASSIVLYTIDSRAAMQENTRLYERFTQNACTQIAYLQADMLDIATYFAVNDEVHALLSTPADQTPQSALFWYEQTPVAFLQNILAIKNHLKTLILYPENGFAPFYISRDASVHDTMLSAIRQQPLYKAAAAARGDVLWARESAGDGGFYRSNKSDKIIAYRELYDLSKNTPLGFLVIGMDAGQYLRICQNALQQPNEGIVVLSGAGDEFARIGAIDDTVLAALCADPAGLAAAQNGGYTGGGWRVFAAADGETGVQVYYFSPQANWYRPAATSVRIPLILALALVLASVPLSWFISRTTLRSTRALCGGMARFREGDFRQQLPVTTADEIGELTASFNTMVHDIRELIDKTYVMQLREREIELDVLQAQINPHFLYNALDSLYWQAEDAGNGDLAENILALSNMFRLMLNQGESHNRVGQELELVRCYLRLQQNRFGNRLTCDIRVADELNAQPIPKLTLQPFVENAIVHGIERTPEHGHIEITGTVGEGKMTFTVKDNGVGMDQAVADELLQGPPPNHAGSAAIGRYAIRNIRQRLDLEYGPGRYELRIRSAPGQGTRVELVLPTG